jgi:hypothetical protein
MKRRFCCFVAAWSVPAVAVVALNVRSTFHGASVLAPPQRWQEASSSSGPSDRTTPTMRKQKASDKRTRRRQRGDVLEDWVQAKELRASFTTTVADSPMQAAGAWSHKRSMTPPTPLASRQLDSAADLLMSSRQGTAAAQSGGRGRSRKRSTLYNSLAFYHNKFLNLLTQEYQAEVRFGAENLVVWRTCHCRAHGCSLLIICTL